VYVNIKGEWENVKGYRAGMSEIEKTMISNLENKKISPVSRNLKSFWSKFLHSG
jgi:hypothetical protein